MAFKFKILYLTFLTMKLPIMISSISVTSVNQQSENLTDNIGAQKSQKKAGDDIFASTSKLKDLLENELKIIEKFENFEQNVAKQIKIIEDYVSNQKRFLINGNENLDVSNPVNAFLLIRKTSLDYEHASLAINEIVKIGKDINQWIYEFRINKNFPQNEDFNRAVAALIRIQNTYKLDMLDFSKGILNRASENHISNDGYKAAVRSLSVLDLLFLGRYSLSIGNYEQAVKWFLISKEFSLIEVDGARFNNQINLELANAMNINKLILKHEDQGLKITSKSSTHNSNEVNKVEQNNFFDAHNSIEFIPKLHKWQTEEQEEEHYERLCRGEELLEKITEKDLKCFLKSEGSAYLKISPIKIEVKSNDPYIVIIHDFITDEQANRLIELGKPKLRRAYLNEENDNIKTQKRSCHNGWLRLNDDSAFLTKISKRIQIATGLKAMEEWEAEQYQVANYGIGGHCLSHPDFLIQGPNYRDWFTDWDMFVGDRIATLMIYLTNVKHGGATVFPRAGVKIESKKGSAAFWWNLDTSGIGDQNTIHGGCPVIHGDKWVANKWIRSNEQFINAPCDLQQSTKFKRPL